MIWTLAVAILAVAGCSIPLTNGETMMPEDPDYRPVAAAAYVKTCRTPYGTPRSIKGCSPATH